MKRIIANLAYLKTFNENKKGTTKLCVESYLTYRDERVLHFCSF